MKVLIATTYLYNQNWPEFTRNKTGFGIMVNDIVSSLAEQENVKFISYVITKGHGNYVEHHTWFDVFKNMHLSDIKSGVIDFFKYQQELGGRLRYIYYSLNKGYVRKIITEFKPDLVHIHGIGKALQPYLEVCQELSIPYLVTLHGIISLDKTVFATEWDKKVERDFLIKAENSNIPVTVISTGMKQRIEERILHHKAKNITVICNGTNAACKPNLLNEEKFDLRKKYEIKNDEKIIVAIGSLCERKNQIQIIRAMATGAISTPCKVFLCGVDGTNGVIQQNIEENNLLEIIHVLGFLEREKIDKLLDLADLNIVASMDEGFGLSIIEAYTHGVPTVTFSDLDAVPDLYDEKAMITVDSREDIRFAESIEAALKRTWDKDWIQRYSSRFSLQEMCKKYVHLYAIIAGVN